MQRILFISLSNIGDAVMTTPALEQLHRIYPDALIDIVAGERSAPVFEHCPYRGEIILKDKKKRLRGYPDLLRQCRRHYYDLVVDLRTDGFSLLLRTARRCQKGGRERPPGQHAVVEHLSTIGEITGPVPQPQTTIWLSDVETEFAEATMAPLAGMKCLAIGAGCGGPEKVWPAACFAELANRLQADYPAVVLLGGPGDQKYSDAVGERLESHLLDLTGQTGILQAAAVIARCELFVGNDSGLGHLASAVRTPSLSFFGVGDPDRYHPWQARAAWLCGTDREVANISVEQALAAIPA